jgi:3-deoxy-D-manno-octulosonic-acid transferase
LLTIIAPRHPERGPEIQQQAIPLTATRRANGSDPPRFGIWIVDTLGELGLLYRLSGVALIGRSLVPPGGGQNPLEAAKLGCAVAVGSYTGNFSGPLKILEEAGAAARVRDAGTLAHWVATMLEEPARRDAMGQAGVAASARFADLPAHTAARLLDLMTGRTRPAVD